MSVVIFFKIKVYQGDHSSLLKTLYESTSEEDDNGEEDEGENKSGLLDLEDLAPMMNTMKQAKVTS